MDYKTHLTLTKQVKKELDFAERCKLARAEKVNARWTTYNSLTYSEALAKFAKLIKKTKIPEADVIEICNEYDYVPENIELISTGNTRNEAYAEFSRNETEGQVPEFLENFVDYSALGKELASIKESAGAGEFVFIGEPGNYRLYYIN